MFDSVIYHYKNAPVRGQMFIGVLVTEKYGQVFTGELKVCNGDSM